MAIASFSLHVFSSGMGVQSTAAMVLMAQGKLHTAAGDRYTHLVFAHVGEDSEHPKTLAYLEEVALPFAQEHGLRLEVLRKTYQRGERKGQPQTVLGRLEGATRTIPIPARMSNGSPGNRNCTTDFKVKVIAAWTKAQGATPQAPATLGIGFSADEAMRVGNGGGPIPWQTKDYPLLRLRLRRADCIHLIQQAGLPVPPKSSCFFCPFLQPAQWLRMRREEPDLFFRAAEVERAMNEKRVALGRDRVWLTRFAVPLEEAIVDTGQTSLFDLLAQDEEGGQCDSGHCWR